MPLDALGGRTVVSLVDFLTELGVTPVPMKDLEAHKAEQIRRNPPSIWLTPKPYMTFGLTAFVGLLGTRYAATGVVGVGTLVTAFFLSLGMTGCFALALGAILDVKRVRLRSKATWVERHAFYELMPEPVERVMRHVKDRVPNARFIYGELVQRSQVLDPYLVIYMPMDRNNLLPWAGQRACLGIWDDDGIIRIATVD
jgi:hypothetical protein